MKMTHGDFHVPDELMKKARIAAILRTAEGERPNASLIIKEALEEYFEHHKLSVDFNPKPNTKR